MAETRKPLLDLRTLVERECICIDGAYYELRQPEEMSILDFYRVASRAEELEQHIKAGDLDVASLGNLRDTLDAVARAVFVGVPDEVWARLTDRHKLDILSVFSTRRRVTTPNPAPATENPQTGEN